MPTCVYCGAVGPCTREHVVPRFLYDYVDTKTVDAWNESTKSRVGGQHTVKDVCGTCNSGALSVLDVYGKRFLEENGLLKPLYVSEVTLTYDYALLLRWLLKIIFNASRASKDQTHTYHAFSEFIRTGENAPSPKYHVLLGELLQPHQPQVSSTKYNVLSIAHAPSNPFIVRITKARLPLKKQQCVEINSVGFGGMFFHLATVNTALTAGYASRERRSVIRGNALCSALIPSSSRVHIRTSNRDWKKMREWQDTREEWLVKHGADLLG